jgi:GNAT superfamily N-acetyltransferase
MERSVPRVKVARDEERVVGTITVAFVADPAMRWLYPGPTQYLLGFPKLLRALGHGAFEAESAHEVSEFAGAAIWLRPGVQPDKASVGQVIESTVGARLAPKVFEILEALDRCHPVEPHWYLPFIGVDAPRQRGGLGSLLLRHALEQVDREHTPAYLETANPGNIQLYQRHGFELLPTITLVPAPALYPMVRPAR